VADLIEQHLGQKPVTLESAAFELGMTARTLQRRLRGEGTSLRTMIQEHRNLRANRQLADKSASLAEIAQALGYADRTVLWRAYKRWEGKPPRRT
jgi:AraC-like DNA-binding protein